MEERESETQEHVDESEFESINENAPLNEVTSPVNKKRKM